MVDSGVDLTRHQCRDGARLGERDVLADDTAMSTILLVGNAHCRFGGSVECGKGRDVGYDGVIDVVKGNVARPELFCAAAVLFAVSGVFSGG
jgi:hypothetical protein